MKKLFIFISIFILIFALTGCSSDSSNSSSDIATGFNVYGTIVESGNGIPLAGVTVTLGSRQTVTNAEGSFSLENVQGGSYSLTAILTGYDTYQQNITLQEDSSFNIDLTTDGPAVAVDNLLLDGIAISGTQPAPTSSTYLTLSGNVNDLVASRTTTASSIGIMSTAITITDLEALVNGEVYVISTEPDGSFNQDVPLNPGDNTIQLRVFDDSGNAGTSPVVRVEVTLDNLDIRTVLKWDTDETDVDLHMFKRATAAENPAADSSDWNSDDRHVYYLNKMPDDFGITAEQNPFLDIDDMDGYGPETIVLQEATSGVYHIWVHYYNAYSSQSMDEVVTDAEVNIIINGGTEQAQMITLEKTLTYDWEFWYLGYVNWPAGTFVEVNQIMEPANSTNSVNQTLLHNKK